MVTFKQIQLVGFKSFADKTVIPLTDGVTCIVGPNGCGKSNVADAIRWVLGEQSAKMMRGSQMLDVIFGGTEKRRQMSFCEVTLTFDNTNRIFDIDCDEVEMTRRLYRDGDSEYLLNRQPSRMKVLTGLLHGAGAAKEGYSIIGQGRIEQIMNAKPEDRRAIFEEATGIVVYKDRKAETERKLALTKDNLYIFMQGYQDIERRIPPLEKAAENAIKYRELFAEQRAQEINLFLYKTDRAKIELADYSRQAEKLNGEGVALDRRSEELLNEYHERRDKRAEYDREIQDLNDRMRRYEVGIEHMSGEAKLYSERARNARSSLNSANETISYSSKRIDEIDREIKRDENLAETKKRRIESINSSIGELQTQIDGLSKRISEYEYMTGEHRKKVLDAFKDLTELRENMGSLSAQKELLSERLSELSKDMEKIRSRRDTTKREYDEAVSKANSIIELLSNEDEILSEAESKVAECDNKVQLFVKQVYDAQAKISSLQSNLETQRSLKDRFEGYIYSVRRLMNDSKDNFELSSRIKGMIADVVSCGEEYEVAIETAFGGAMQNIITSTRDDARYLIEYLKRMRAGQVTFLPIEALKPHYENDQIKSAAGDTGALGFAIDLVKFDKKFENVIHNLLGNTLIVDNIQNATQIARRYPRAFKIVTLEGDVIAVSGSMTGGSKREVAGNLLATERRIKEIEEAIAVKKSFLDRSDLKRAELEESKKAATDELNALQNKLQQARVDLAQLNEKQSSLLNAVADAESEYAAYAQSRDAISGRLAGLDSEYSGVSRGADDLSQQSDEASSKMDDMTAEFDKVSSDRMKALEKLNSLKLELASLESSLKAGEDNVARLMNEKVTLIKKIDETSSMIPQIQRDLDELTAKAERASLTDEEFAVVNDLKRQLNEATESKKQCDERIKEIDSERLRTADEKSQVVAKLHNIDLDVQRINDDLANLKSRVEEYEETEESCQKYRIADFEPTGATTRINSLKRQIQSLGSINHNAVEELEELKKEYEKKTAEKEDIEKAVNDLTVVLEDLKAEMLQKFNEGFTLIGENFKRTFKELFGGGRAELQLDYTDCDDPLNAGVEIIACPPGKKLTKISLLSGGERALTAIAILFAIIGMRPMPFCVLDEIEAALDEANVSRYARYLKKFSEQTQFIVITHRKPTMENADVLFGVTMEEKGVSKIVSVKLSEVESRLGGDTVA